MISGNSIGIDYHQNSVQICILSSDGKRLGNRSLENSVPAVLNYVNKFGVTKGGGIEMSCGAANFVDELRAISGWDIRLCHPGYVNRMKRNPDKSDKSDAELIADLYRVGYLPEVWLSPEALRDLRQLVRFRSQQIQWQREVKQRIRSLFRQFRIKTPPAFNLTAKKWKGWALEHSCQFPTFSELVLKQQLLQLTAIEQTVGSVEKQMGNWAKQDRLCVWLMNMRGVGLITAMLIRCEIGTATRFERSKQLARFCGLTPRNASSGERQAESGLVHAGNPDLKRTLLQVAHVLRRYDPHWRQFALNLASKGKHGNVCIAAIANRWIRRLYHQMKEFELNIQQPA